MIKRKENNSVEISKAQLGRGNPTGCTNMSLEIPIKVCVKNKELILYGDSPRSRASTATYRIYLVAYRELGD